MQTPVCQKRALPETPTTWCPCPRLAAIGQGGKCLPVLQCRWQKGSSKAPPAQRLPQPLSSFSPIAGGISRSLHDPQQQKVTCSVAQVAEKGLAYGAGTVPIAGEAGTPAALQEAG